MANIKITELNEILKKDNADVLPIVDVSANETKKIAIEDLLDKNIALIAVTDTEPAECSTGDKYYNTTTKKIYTAINTDVWGEDGEDPISGILYIVYDEQASYSWDGTDLVSVGGGKEDIVIDDTQPTDPDVKLWIDTGEIAQQVSEITNEYSTSTGIGYSANYVNTELDKKLTNQTTSSSVSNCAFNKMGKLVVCSGWFTVNGSSASFTAPYKPISRTWIATNGVDSSVNASTVNGFIDILADGTISIKMTGAITYCTATFCYLTND